MPSYHFKLSNLAIALLILTSLLQANCEAVYFVDTVQGNDKSLGTGESPLKTLTEAIKRLAATPGTILLQQNQIFSDLAKQTTISANLTIKCWVDGQYATILASQADSSFLLQGNLISLTFESIRFQREQTNTAKALIAAQSPSSINLSNVIFENFLTANMDSIIKNTANSAIMIQNTNLSNINFNNTSFLHTAAGTVSLNNISMSGCTVTNISAIIIFGGALEVMNSTFDSNNVNEGSIITITILANNSKVDMDSVNVTVANYNNNVGSSSNEEAIFFTSRALIADIFVNNLEVTNNMVYNGSSGFRVAASMFTIMGSRFTNNSDHFFENTTYPLGAGVVYSSANYFSILQSNFTNNNHALGGAVNIDKNKQNTEVTICECNFTRNKALFGGAVYVDPSMKDFRIAVDDSTFYWNVATETTPLANDGGLGGAFYFAFVAKADYEYLCFFERNSFIKNIANASVNDFGIAGAGGGIYYQPTTNKGNCTLTDNIFLGNIANFGGGILFKRGVNLLARGNIFMANEATINGGAASIQKINFSDNSNNTAQFGGALFIQEGTFYFNNSAFSLNRAYYNGGGLSAQTVSNLTIENSNFTNCSCDAMAGAISVSTNSQSEIRKTRFEDCKALQGSAIYYAENFVGPQTLKNCLFLNNTSEFSLMQSLLSTIRAYDVEVLNNTGTILAQVSTNSNFTNVSAINTQCQRSNLGCLLDSISTESHFDRINITNMRMFPENSAVSLRQRQSFSMTNAVITNINGSLNGACLSASNTSVVLENWVVKNFYSGCVSVTNTNATIKNFTMDNYEYSKIYNNTENPQQIGSALFLNGGFNFTVSNVVVLGNQNVTSRGAAIDVENSTYFYLEHSRFQDNEAEIGGALYIGFMPAIVHNVTLVNNIALKGGGLFAEGFRAANTTAAMLNFSLLNFTGNRARLSGGGAHFENLENCSLWHSTFDMNTGLKATDTSLFSLNSKGGAVYYSCDAEECATDISNNTFTNNIADVGGAIYYNAHIFTPKDSIFSNNTATSHGGYGPVFGSYPIQLLYGKEMYNDAFTGLAIVFDNGTTISRSEYIKRYFINPENFTETNFNNDEPAPSITLKLRLLNQTGGKSFTQNVSFYGIDHFGQQITVDNPDFCVRLDQENETSVTLTHSSLKEIDCRASLPNSLKIDSINGAFILSGGFINSPGGSLKLRTATNMFEKYPYDRAYYDKTSFLIDISFRKCAVGEILPVNTDICSICPPNTFSLEEPTNSSLTCSSCNKIRGAMCKKGGASLTVAPGYWRHDNLSKNVLSCSNQVACNPPVPDTKDCFEIYPDLKPGKLDSTCQNITDSSQVGSKFPACSPATIASISAYCGKIQNGTELGVCNQGYEGILCGQCQEGWGTSSQYKCVKCEKTAWFFVQFVFFGLLRMSVIGYTVYQAHEGKRDKDQSSTLRILINYFQAINILLVIPFQWPEFVTTFKSYFISLFSSGSTSVGGFSYECILDWMGFNLKSVSYFQWNAFYSFLSPIYWTILIGLLIVVKNLIERKSLLRPEFKESMIITFIVTYFYIWPDMMTVAFSLFNCVDVGSTRGAVYVLQPDPTLECYSKKHWLLLMVSAIPTIIIWGILLPFICFTMIRRKRHSDMLGEETFAKKYGFIYQGYTRRYYWWEFMILGRKVVLLVISVFLIRNLTVMCLTLFLATIAFTGLQLRGTPFTNNVLNSLELTSLFSLGAIIYACLYHLSLSNEGSTISFVGVAAIFTLIFFVQWVGYYFIFLREKISNYWLLTKQCFRRVGKLLGYNVDPNRVEETEKLIHDPDDEDCMSDRHPSQGYEELQADLKRVHSSSPANVNSPLQEPLMDEPVISSQSPQKRLLEDPRFKNSQ